MYNLYMANRILIVDDYSSWTSFHKELINQAFPNKFDITVTDLAYKAWDIINENKDNPFDIILTDLQMEESYEHLYAGEWLIEQIKTLKEYQNTHIVIISSTFNIANIANRHSVDYIFKPYLINNKLLLSLTIEKYFPDKKRES